MFIVLEVAGLPVAQEREDVIVQLIASVLTNVELEKVALLAPTLLPLIFH